MSERLRDEPLDGRLIHLCVDMQRIFSHEGVWATPWMERVLPVVARIVEKHPQRTIFTRFITPMQPQDMRGRWISYYQKWRQTTRQFMDPAMLDLVPELARYCPPAQVIDKTVYSAFSNPALLHSLKMRAVTGVIITGSETDVCVLASVLAAVDFGFRVIVVRDAVCSSSDAGHDAMMEIYHRRYSQQIETADAETILKHWK